MWQVSTGILCRPKAGGNETGGVEDRGESHQRNRASTFHHNNLLHIIEISVMQQVASSAVSMVQTTHRMVTSDRQGAPSFTSAGSDATLEALKQTVPSRLAVAKGEVK